MSDIVKARHEAAETAECYLLDLPGELRNMIYSFAKEVKPITFYSRRLKNCSAKELEVHGIKLSKTEPDFSVSQIRAVRSTRGSHLSTCLNPLSMYPV